ncbi:MAG: N-acetyltransferase family protein [Planctomycetaceae bacterium]
MPGEVQVRAATLEDWESYRDVRLAALRTDPGAFGSRYDDEVRTTPERWRERAAIAEGATFLAFADGRAVGTATAAPWDGLAGVLGLFGMWVDPGWRGRGVGAGLVDAVLRFGRDHGYPTVQLWVAEGEEAPRRLYERCGFVDTGERRPIRDEPGAFTCMVMRWSP